MGTHFDDVGQFRSVLRSGLREAMKGRDTPAVSAIRSVLAAIDNAEAVESQATSTPTTSEHVAGASVGVGSAEADRRPLTPEDLREIIRSEIGQRTSAAAEYEAHGQHEAAARLHSEVAALTRYV